jgi:hypothetical protein
MRFCRLTALRAESFKEVIIFPMTRASNTSPRKAAANRRNASRSTGPRTALGKSWSRRNALKHGILASQAVIATIEGRAERKMFEATVDGLAADFQPVGAYEQLLVQEIAACFWRKRRLLMFENRAAFDAIEVPNAAIVERGLQQLYPWKEPLYAQDGQMTTAEHIYKQSGLDAVTLPNEQDTLRVIRYEAAIDRTRERAVRSLREMRKLRGHAAAREQTPPAVDRVAARRNAGTRQARILSPWVTIKLWNQYKKDNEEVDREEQELRAALEGKSGQADQTKPKTIDISEMRRSLYRAIYGREMPEDDVEDAPEGPQQGAADAAPGPDKPPTT